MLRQLQGAVLGLVALVIFMRIDYHAWQRWSGWIMLGTLLLLALVLIPQVGVNLGGARRWIGIGPLTFQPSELCKLTLIIYMANWLSRKGAKVRRLTYGLVPFSLTLGVVVGLIMLQPDLGSATVIVLIAVALFFIAGADILQLGAIFVIGSASFAGLVFSASYRMNRVLAFLDPWKDPSNIGYHTVQSLLAVGAGGLFGVGLGQSRQKFQYLPVPHSDTIFSVLAEELGLLGGVIVVGLFVALAFRGFRVALRAKDSYGSLLAVGITVWFMFQALINIGGVTAAIPFTGITLPFISSGSSSLMITLAAVGLLLNVSRSAHKESEGRANPGHGRRNSGTRVSRSLSPSGDTTTRD
jgi:cell division protein FtsW